MFIDNGGVRLHAEVDGDGAPVTVFAHGLTNSCDELALFTPLMPGTRVRFCFRGHGHSEAPVAGYRFADFASDLSAVAQATGATRAVGTSLGAGAICTLLERDPERFDAMVFLLPAAVDQVAEDRSRFVEMAELLESLPPDEAVDAILAQRAMDARAMQMPWMQDLASQKWAGADLAAAARAIREVTADRPMVDRTALRAVQAPVLIVCRKDDPIHPVSVGEAIAEQLVNADLRVFGSDEELLQAIPTLIARAQEILA